MKKYIYIILAVVFFSSCSDFLDREPKDSLFPGIFWGTESDVKLAITACYRGFEGSTLYRDCASDNAYNFHRHEGWQALGDGSAVPGDPGSSMFSYTTIRKCNELLENIDNVTFKDGSEQTAEQKKKAYIGEARFIRAYRYFIMTQFYGDVPLMKTNFATPEAAAVPRDPRETVEQFIISELKDISENKFLLEKQADSDKGRFTISAAYALLSRVHLFRGENAEAITAAKAVKGHGLLPGSYESLFLLENNSSQEAIVELQYLKNHLNMSFTAYMPNSAGGWSSVVPLQSLVDNYETLDGLTIEEAKANGTYDEANPYINRDPRLRATIIYPGQSWNGKIYKSIIVNNNDHPLKADNSSKSGYNFKKYFNNLDQYAGEYWQTGKHLMVIRYAEVLLNLAEAKIESNQIDGEMYSAIDAVRTRAGLPVVDRAKYNTQVKLRELVRRERRSEFAFEGLRRFDIIRWNIAKDVMNGMVYGARQGTILEDQLLPNGDATINLTGAPFEVETRKFVNRNMLLPIPQASIDKNPKLLPNNPEY